MTHAVYLRIGEVARNPDKEDQIHLLFNEETAMSPPKRYPVWLPVALQTLLGALLQAGLQLLLLAIPPLPGWLMPFSWGILIGGIILIFALLPGSASWLAATQTGKGWAGFISGCLVGLLGFFLFIPLVQGWSQFQEQNSSPNPGYGMGVAIFVLFEVIPGTFLTICASLLGAYLGSRRYQAVLQAAEAEENANME